MVTIFSLQQTGQMSGHMTNQNSNQDTILLITLILGLIIIVLVATIIGILYLFYTGRLSFAKKTLDQVKVKSSTEQPIMTSEIETGVKKNAMELPPVSLNPLERKILEVVITGHNVLQADLPNLVKSSKSKVSEALTSLEERKLVQRIKTGRTLTITYTYKPVT